ncbi:DUF1566 domain-containing protein [Seonamhaeicola sp.]|uniref:Lcl C-terminal domain-containing protein n=1 Tax=Seonamhaeicola sp. TaxID=1912245 RepID=UPI00261D7780|nr:DUF1566 domain-containing protein [Seonamhaeicola sp.]
MNKKSILLAMVLFVFALNSCEKDDKPQVESSSNLPDISGYPIVSSSQTNSYNNNTIIALPTSGQDFYGQNSNYIGTSHNYVDNGDGTITDMVTGLMWTQSPDWNNDGFINYSDKQTLADAESDAETSTFAGYDDWRLPSIKELYSLVMFHGAEPSPTATSQGTAVPFINTNYFEFGYGDLSAGERLIDAQYATTTIYVSTTMNGDRTMFGYNFADGRIKGYPTDINPGMQSNEANRFYVLYVRGNSEYGQNDFLDNGNETITDNATGLMWTQNDSGMAMLWKDALAYAENYEFAGYSDWRLPDPKELHSIVDYSRSPATTNTAAIDPIFNASLITNEAGAIDYPYYWTNTTFCSQSHSQGSQAVYFSFGRSLGYINGNWIDVHGAGAQRSDPKTGDPTSATYSQGFGPQNDAVRISNFVRLVRNVE